ncbi:MAG: KamA family radical SAM protein [Planctomycetes bacterium]|nr:KamA family radical SAM protein [Planctomycetota bacterium]MBU1518352.1 KamA family radical SAM protein [Planctomycetota bacterium]MBU2458555.1 KamA family radical SAM protein [Planctomycetota bacterium]
MTAELKQSYVTDVKELKNLSQAEVGEVAKVAAKYPFYCSEYYLSLIDWNDPNDPIRQVVVPHAKELEKWGRLDPSDEQSYTVMPGLEHKYNSTALLLVSKTCAGICRYCFRKRVFLGSKRDCITDLPAALNYISQHKEITNVLLTGGDPLMLSTDGLEEIITKLRQIDHVQIIRIGTRMPVYNPYRIAEDKQLLDLIEKYSTPYKKIYMMTHFVHPRELTDIAIQACHLMKKAGAEMTNQTPLIKGINDNPDVLAELFAKLSFYGVVPYYVFQCRPASGNKAYTVPIETGYDIFEQAKARISGLAKRARFVMSHSSGKIEIIGKTDTNVFMKYHRAADDSDSGKFMIFKSNPQACWFDDYDEVNYPADKPYRSYGPE